MSSEVGPPIDRYPSDWCTCQKIRLYWCFSSMTLLCHFLAYLTCLTVFSDLLCHSRPEEMSFDSVNCPLRNKMCELFFQS